MTTYLGSALLSGPVGGPDTAEWYLPQPRVGVSTVLALVIEAESPEAAREKQIIWHALQERLHRLKTQQPYECYAARRQEVLERLADLAAKVLLA